MPLAADSQVPRPVSPASPTEKDKKPCTGWFAVPKLSIFFELSSGGPTSLSFPQCLQRETRWVPGTWFTCLWLAQMSYLLAADKQCSSLTPEVRIQKLAQMMPAAICADPAMTHAIQTLSGALPQKRSPKNMGLNPFIKYLLNIVDRLLADFHSWLPAHKWLTPQSHRNNQYPQYVRKPSLANRKSFCSKNLRLDRTRSTCFYLYVGEKIWDVDLPLFCFAFRSVLFFFFFFPSH